MELITRNKDIITGSDDLEELHSLKEYPIFMGCVKQPLKEDLRAEQTWVICRKSGIIQLKKLIPLEILYKEHHNSGAVGATWMDHHQKFSEYILKNNPKNVLEIGGGHGILAKKCLSKIKIPWTILEPNPNPVEGCEASFLEGFFDDKFKIDSNVDTIIHSHLLEHIYDPIQFFKNLSRTKTSTKLIFSIPNMNEMLKRKYTNCLNFEHTIFLTEPLVEFLLSSNGFELIEKKYYKEDHSIFFNCIKKNKLKIIKLPENYYLNNKLIFNEYINYHNNLINNLNYEINKNHSKVFLFGAHIFSQYLLEFGLNSDKIECILDNDKCKQDKRLYGSRLMVKSPGILKKYHKPLIILKAGAYNEEIKEDILKNINSNAEFL